MKNARKYSRWIFLLAAWCLPETCSWADSVSLHPVADTTLQQNAGYANNNFGDGTTFTAGGRRYGGATRALMQFDIAHNVPAGATINSVSLSLTVTRAPDGAFNSVFDLRRVLDSWGEGTGSDFKGSPAGANQATWNVRFSPGTAWTTPGGDFATTVSGSRSIAGAGGYMFSSTDTLVADVRGWLNNPANNFGWILMSESEGLPTTIRRFGSRDSGASAPTLTIDFTPVPEPSTWALLVMGGIWLILQRRRGQTFSRRSL